MSTEEHRLKGLIESYWTAPGKEAAVAVLKQALGHPPAQPSLLARAWHIARRAGVTAAESRIDNQLGKPLERSRLLLRVVDALGDDQADLDRAVFDELSSLSTEVDLESIDIETVHRARDGSHSRPEAAQRVLAALANALPADLRSELAGVAEALREDAERFPARALVVAPGDDALVLGVRLARSPRPGIHATDDADTPMKKQAQTVLSEHLDEGTPGLSWSLELPVTYSGASLGLALKLAALVTVHNRKPDPLLAATGVVDTGGEVGFVEGLGPKLQAAADAGIRRVLIPAANEEELKALQVPSSLRVVPIGNVSELPAKLNDVSPRVELSPTGRIRKARSLLGRYGLEMVPPYEDTIDHARRLHVADGNGKAILMAWTGRKGRVTTGGKETSARAALDRLVADHLSTSPQSRLPFKRVIADPARRDRLVTQLEAEGAEATPVTGRREQWRYRLQRGQSVATVTQWETGTCVVTGDAPAHDRARSLVLSALGGLNGAGDDPASADEPQGAAVTAPQLPALAPGETWVGTDESGKGDFFGPLVSAAVVLDAKLADELAEMGVRDSKRLNDRRIRALAPQLRRTLGKRRYKVTPINPPRFNSLYREMKAEGKNLNTLLAWGHTRSIEDLLQAGQTPRYAIVDQFADARYIERKLLEDTRQSGMPIIQFPKAEADMAVAAASILAREAFVQWLERESARIGVTLPKGSGGPVIDAGRELVARHGPEALGQWAKLSFKTADRVLQPQSRRASATPNRTAEA